MERRSRHGGANRYIYPCPMDRGVLERWGIAPAEFDRAITEHRTDEAILQWVNARVSPAACAAANRCLLEEKAEDLDRQDREEARSAGST